MTKSKKVKVYLCGVSYQHELGPDGAADGVKVYPTKKTLQKYCGCSKSGCGVVECDLTFSKWVEEQDFDLMRKTSVSIDDFNKHAIKSTKEKIAKLQDYLARLEKEEAGE